VDLKTDAAAYYLLFAPAQSGRGGRQSVLPWLSEKARNKRWTGRIRDADIRLSGGFVFVFWVCLFVCLLFSRCCDDEVWIIWEMRR